MQENTKLYELMILVNGNLSIDEAQKTLTETQKEITTLQGEVTQTEDWGRRELAYKVAKNDYGYYFVIYANLPAESAKELNEFCRLNREIARHLLLIRPENAEIVDYSGVKTKFGAKVKDASEKAVEEESTLKTRKPAEPKAEKKEEKIVEKVEEKTEEPAEEKPAESKKSEKNLDDILSELDGDI